MHPVHRRAPDGVGEMIDGDTDHAVAAFRAGLDPCIDDDFCNVVGYIRSFKRGTFLKKTS